MDESLVTPELESRVGIPSEPVAVEVTSVLVRRLWEMLARTPEEQGDRVPPALLMMPDAGREVAPLPGLPEHSLVTGDEWEMRRALRLGETLTAVNRLADLSERFGSRLGHTLTVRHEWIFTNATGDLVALTRRSMAYYRSEGLRSREERPEEAGPSAPPLAAAPGADPSSAREGDPLDARLLTPSLEQVIRYCAITWNITPIFFDPEAARASGLPGTIIPGPLKLSLLADAVLAWAGPGALLESIRAAHRRPDVPGVPLLIGGSVVRAEEAESGRRLHCEVWIENGRGERSAVGAAVVRVPVAGSGPALTP